VEFVVGTDGIVPTPVKTWRERLARPSQTAAVPPGATAPCTIAEVTAVVSALSGVGRCVVVDRLHGRVYGEGHLAALHRGDGEAAA
jgi:hypothetical protein